MNLLLERLIHDAETTIGVLLAPGHRPVFKAYTLEDEFRIEKVRGETRIRAGKYRIELRREGALHAKYDGLFPRIHQGMLWLLDVPDFEWIYIHVGNRDEDTMGCILVGDSASLSDMTIGASRAAYRRIYPGLAAAAAIGELTIEIVDRDR